MNCLSDVVNGLFMLPYAVLSALRDSDVPYQLDIKEPVKTVLHLERALIVAGDKHVLRKTSQFLGPADLIHGVLVERLGRERVTYLQGDEEAHERFVPELKRLGDCEESVLFVYMGHGSRQHPWLGSHARNRFLTDEQFLEAVGSKPNLVAFFDSCYSGLFARNVQARSNTVAVATNTQRTGKPCKIYLPQLFKRWSKGESLQAAFVAASEDYFAHSFDYLMGKKLSPQRRAIGKRIDSVLRLSYATKQLYANGIDPGKVFF